MCRTSWPSSAPGHGPRSSGRPSATRPPAAPPPPRQRPGQIDATKLTCTSARGQPPGSARQALAEAEQAGDRLAAGYALHALANVSYYRRESTARQEYVDRALSMIEIDPQTTDLRLLLLANKAAGLSNQDRQAEAIATARQALALAERTGAARIHRARSRAPANPTRRARPARGTRPAPAIARPAPARAMSRAKPGS